MVKIGLSGCNGRMGRVISGICAAQDDVKIVAGFDMDTEKKSDYPVYKDPFEFSGKIDVIIDFSNPSALSGILAYCLKCRVPAVLCTTGYSEDQKCEIEKASEKIPVFKSGNMSIGINLIIDILKNAARVLGADYDIEIIEKHHNQKLDAPSGTALMLADAVSSALPYDAEYVYDRHDVRQKRRKNEIGIHAVRGGTIVGEHSVIFAGRDETIEINHQIISREVFAAGAVNAARFLSTRQHPGMYDMSDYVRSKQQ